MKSFLMKPKLSHFHQFNLKQKIDPYCKIEIKSTKEQILKRRSTFKTNEIKK
jgi:hypothetical protein